MTHLYALLDYALHTNVFVLRILIAITACLLYLYRLALPKPIPGIPYNKDAASKLFGDGTAYLEHFKNGGTFGTYCQSVARSLDAPLIQIFIQPFRQPLLVLADFRETQALMRRKDFDRSEDMGDMVLGLMPEHHIRLKTNTAWKAQRLLIKDLMLPSWLHSVAAPEIYKHSLSLIKLWSLKAEMADGRPFKASEDIRRMTMDAVMSFCFGQRFKDTATFPAIEALRYKGMDLTRADGLEEAMEVSGTPLSPMLNALDTLFESVGKIRGSPKPSLTWTYLMRKPRYAQALQMKNAYILAELKHAVEQLQETNEDDAGKSAVHHMVLRERDLAEKDKREPQYLAQVMMDEVWEFFTL